MWKSIAAQLEDTFDDLKAHLDDRLGRKGPLIIVPFRGYGTPDLLTLKGRVLEDKGLKEATESDSTWVNLLSMYKRIDTDEVPGVTVRARLMGQIQDVVTDEEGYFDLALKPEGLLDAGTTWQEVVLEVAGPRGPAHAAAEVLVPPAQATFGIISDIDDTIMYTHATHLLKMAKLTFIKNARTRKPFKGVAGFYEALCRGADGTAQNPIFYVSSSPWNLYDLLVDFMRFNRIPKGPILLRDFGIDQNKFITGGHGTHKGENIARILNMYPALPFVLIGDSGQHDPEIYSQVVADFPGRIKAIYIRDVSLDDRDAEVWKHIEVLKTHGVPMVLVPDSLTAAQDAVDRGLVDPARIDAVRAEKKKDEAAPTAVEQLVDGGA